MISWLAVFDDAFEVGDVVGEGPAARSRHGDLGAGLPADEILGDGDVAGGLQRGEMRPQIAVGRVSARRRVNSICAPAGSVFSADMILRRIV
jgi:hypothetical protein